MASGQKNYFRHHFRAHEHHGMQELIKKHGYHGYFSYFVLAGLCAELIAEGHKFPLKFHESMLMRCLRYKRHQLHIYLTSCSHLMDISSSSSGHLVVISWPNLLKYIGSYSENLPNKIKENKIKENKIKNKSDDFDFDFNNAENLDIDKNVNFDQKSEESDQPTKNEIQTSKIPNSDFHFYDLLNLYPKKSDPKLSIMLLKNQILISKDFEDFKKAIKNYLDHHKKEKTELKFYKSFEKFIGPNEYPYWRQWIDVKPLQDPVFDALDAYIDSKPKGVKK